MDVLITQCLEAGLIQFGRFGGMPFKLHWDLLPSYPDIWSDLLARFTALTDMTQYERLLAPSDSLPLGTLLSFLTRVPLVYSRGNGGEGVHDLAGAYDVGHPALFIANEWRGKEESHRQVIRKAGKVGLEIDTICVIMAYGTLPSDYRLHPLFRFEAVIEAVSNAGRVPKMYADLVAQWLKDNG